MGIDEPVAQVSELEVRSRLGAEVLAPRLLLEVNALVVQKVIATFLVVGSGLVSTLLRLVAVPSGLLIGRNIDTGFFPVIILIVLFIFIKFSTLLLVVRTPVAG